MNCYRSCTGIRKSKDKRAKSASERSDWTPAFAGVMVFYIAYDLRHDALRLQCEGDAEITRAYDVHSVSLSKWKHQCLNSGAEIFSGNDTVKTYSVAGVRRANHQADC